MGNVGGSSAMKLEKELVSYVQCLQNTGLTLLNECIQICENVLEVLERKTTSDSFMESQSLIQYGMKIQGFRKGLEQLTRSLGKTACVLKEKAELGSSEHDLSETADRRVVEDDLKSEFKAERLLTNILKEKLYSKEKEVETNTD
ncbi:(R R)-butanediol dehydrogenase [Bienertia sinuspersici]